MKAIRVGGFALLIFAAATAAFTQYNESSGGQAVIGTGNLNTSYYSPAFAYGTPNCNRYDTSGHLITGQCVFLYVQGNDNLANQTYHDQVLMFWNPATWSGLTSRFAGDVRLLPGVDYLGNPMPTTDYYGGPSVFGYNGTYCMTAHESPDAANFKKQWWGVSSDGQSWTWYPLFDYTGSANLNISQVSLQPVTIGTQVYFYGFIRISSDGGIGTGVIRLRANTSTARGYDLVEMYGSATGAAPWAWVTIVDPSTNPSGTFSNVVPGILLPSRDDPKYLENGELWTVVLNGAKTCTSPCPAFGGTTTGWSDRFDYRAVTVPSTLSSPPSFGSDLVMTSSVRCIPADYETSRNYPMPLTTGSPRLLYSASNDVNYAGKGYCGSTPARIFYGMYIVLTGFN